MRQKDLKSNLSARLIDLKVPDQKGQTALIWAAELGHEKILQMLLDKGEEVNAQDKWYGHALQAASAPVWEKIVQTLQDKGAEINAQGGHHVNAYQAASAPFYEKIVQICLDEGAKVDAQGGYFGNGQQAVSSKSYEKVVQILQETWEYTKCGSLLWLSDSKDTFYMMARI